MRLNRIPRYAVVLVVFGFGLIGLLFMLTSRAAEPSAELEAEKGTLAGNAAVVADVSASGGKAVTFGGATPAMQVYFGSTHNHTGSANTHGQDESDAKQVFDAAKANNFDWLIITEHSGGTGPSSQGKVPADFYANVISEAAAHTDNTFVGIPGYEFSDNDSGSYKGQTIGAGHMTGVNTDDFVNADGATNTAASLEDYLADQVAAGKKALGGFNHPGSGGHPGSIPALLTPAHRNVIVMSENFNSMESSADAGNTDGWIAELDRGWRVGPTCGLDGHGLGRLKMTVDSGPCRTGIVAQSLTFGNIYDALMARRIFSTRDIDLQVTYKANGQWMGSSLGTPASVANVAFDINASDPDTSDEVDKITKIQIRTEGGALVSSYTVPTPAHSVNWQTTIPTNGKKYFYVLVYNGERTTYTAAAAPVWME